MKFCISITPVLSFGIVIIVLGTVSLSHAQVRNSANYQLQSDSINVGGGPSNSASYTQESTTGEVATGRSTSTNFSLRAGYQQMQEVYVSLAGGADIVMDPALPGLTGGESNGSTTFTVITDSPSGYLLTIRAENEPAMRGAGGVFIDEYPTPGFTPDFTFAIDPGEAYFGITVEGVNTSSLFRDNGSGCNLGVFITVDTCWLDLKLSNLPVAVGRAANHPSGATTTIKFRVGIGSGANVESGEYYATTTVTALPL